jgi:hypothetical protein
MARGDHIITRLVAYSHHGIDLGDGTVVHWTKPADATERCGMVRLCLAALAAGTVNANVEPGGARTNFRIVFIVLAIASLTRLRPESVPEDEILPKVSG